MPQFLNVFSGAMSLVGPRPHMIIHNRRFSEIMDQYHVRTFAKPGITGPRKLVDIGVKQKMTRTSRNVRSWTSNT